MAAIMDYYFYNADGSLVFSDHPTSGEVKIVFTDRSATIYIDGFDTPYEEVTFSTINTGYRVDKWGTIEENYSAGETYIYEDNGIGLTVKVYAITKEETTSKVLTIKYNGKVIATLERGQTATIPCDGKKMATDLVVGISKSVNLISFTINTGERYAEQGMTWGEWVESEYNTDGYKISTLGGCVHTADVIETQVQLDQKSVTASETIVNGAAYELVTILGGSN